MQLRLYAADRILIARLLTVTVIAAAVIPVRGHFI